VNDILSVFFPGSTFWYGADKSRLICCGAIEKYSLKIIDKIFIFQPERRTLGGDTATSFPCGRLRPGCFCS
jgi:hypothetical protein